MTGALIYETLTPIFVFHPSPPKAKANYIIWNTKGLTKAGHPFFKFLDKQEDTVSFRLVNKFVFCLCQRSYDRKGMTTSTCDKIKASDHMTFDIKFLP